METKIKAALIDMDGTLYDSMPNHARAWVRVMNEIGIEAHEEEFFRYEGCTGAWIINLMIKRAFGRHATDDEKTSLYALKAKYFSEQPPVPVMPGAKLMVERLKSRGIRTVLVTGSGQKSLLDRLERDFPGSFPTDMRVTSASVSHGKPHPEPFIKALELAGVDASEAIAIDNAPLGTTSARAAGVFTVGVLTGPIPRADIEQTKANIIYNSMAECAENISELLYKIENHIL